MKTKYVYLCKAQLINKCVTYNEDKKMKPKINFNLWNYEN